MSWSARVPSCAVGKEVILLRQDSFVAKLSISIPGALADDLRAAAAGSVSAFISHLGSGSP